MALRQATKSAKAANTAILPYHNLVDLKLGKHGVVAFGCRFRNLHAYTANACRLMEQNNSAVGRIFLQRWAERQDPLWWSCIAFIKGFDSKRTRRSWAARRLRTAFVESLKKQGYAANGTRLDGSGRKPLFGTAQLSPHEPMFKTKIEDLVKQTDIAVAAMLGHTGKFPVKKTRETTNEHIQGKKIGGPKPRVRPKEWKIHKDVHF
jgi:hypothetical protein